MRIRNEYSKRGFTLLELLIVVAIIGILVAIVLSTLGDSRIRALDSARISNAQEVLKTLELYYSDNHQYPTFNGGSTNAGGNLIDIDNDNLYGAGGYIRELPDEANRRFFYCVSTDRQSILLAVDTQVDPAGGSNYCRITHGSGPYGCPPAIDSASTDFCKDR